MKKVLTMALLAVLILCACEKEDASKILHKPSRNRVVTLYNDGKTKNSSFLFALAIGHSKNGCPGCAMVNNQLVHIDCMGNGNYCALTAAVQLQQAGATINATTTDMFDLTTENFFLMPNRSLDYVDEKNNHYYLNIPGQMVYRDTATLQFTFTGLFFSEAAAYENE